MAYKSIKSMKKANTNTTQTKQRYVVDKAKMAKQVAERINKPFSYDIEQVFDERTFKLFPNLDRNLVPEYKYCIRTYFITHNLTDEYEMLVWTSELLHFFNSINLDEILKELDGDKIE